MPPEKDDVSYLWDMLDAAKAIKEFIGNRSYQDYLHLIDMLEPLIPPTP